MNPDPSRLYPLIRLADLLYYGAREAELRRSRKSNATPAANISVDGAAAPIPRGVMASRKRIARA